MNATHPQILPYIGDTNSQVDVWDNFARVITPGGHAEPAARLGARRGDDPALRPRRARRRGAVHHDQGGPDRPLGHGRRHPRAVAAGRRRPRRRVVATPRWSTTSTTRCSRTSTRGAPSTASSTASGPNGDDHRARIMEVFFLAPFSGRAAAAGADPPARRRRVVDRGARSSACSARCSTRTPSTWSGCSSAWRARSSRASRSPTTRRARSAGCTPLLGQWCEGGLSDVRDHPSLRQAPSTSRTATAPVKITKKDGRVGLLPPGRLVRLRRGLRRRPAALRLGGRPAGHAPPAERPEDQLSSLQVPAAGAT